jgi:predicted exporter
LSRRAVRSICLGITGLAIVGLVYLPSPWRGSLSALSPISAADLARDADLRADLGPSESGTLVVISAPSEAAALELAEAAGARLDPIVERGALQGYASPARFLPSPRMQLARRSALPDASTLRQQLAEATADGALPAQRLGRFIDDVQTARAQAVLDRAQLQGTALATALDALLVPASSTRPWRALLSLNGTAQGVDIAAVRQALADLPAARVLNISVELNSMYDRYLREAAWQAAFGALAVLALLGAHLRDLTRLARIFEPMAAAVLLVVAGLAASGVGLGILHLVGLLLVVAIGSNYALFFDHLRHHGSADPDTLASLLLANLTTVLSFGLLAMSNIEALHAIGQVVAPGALLSLVLSAVFVTAARSAR